MRTRPVRALSACALGLTLLLTAACSGGDNGSAADAPAPSAGDFEPVTIEHQFGSTRIEERPERVLTAGFNEQDFALALGVVPVGAREFLGYDAPRRPWAAEALQGVSVPTVGAQEIDLEQVASLRPDLILAVNAFIDEATYDQLSQIAPTVAQSADYADGATPWQEQTRTTGEALGLSEEADDVVDDVEQQFADARADHPELDGTTATFGLGVGDTGTYELGRDDYRTGWLVDLGLEVPASGGDVALEQLDQLEADVVVVEGVEGDVLGSAVGRALPAVREDRVVDLGPFDGDLAAAIGFNSPLSLPTVLDLAVPQLSAAADDDPQTVPEPYTG